MSSKQVRTIEIGSKTIGPGLPTFIIAEAGVNHNGDLEVAKQLIDVAINAGADAVKFQTFRADAIASPDAPKANYQLATTDVTESQLELLRRLELSKEAHYELNNYCQGRDIIFLSTPFDESAADMLSELGVPAFKISSGDLTNAPLLEHVAAKGKPVILSTGMANLDEVAAAVSVLREAGCDELALLHCVTNYPAAVSDVNLRAVTTMAHEFRVPVGYSDHTDGIEVAIAAVALGACIIEKHFTLDRSLPGPDHKASLEPNELRALVSGIRNVEAALGDGRKVPTVGELETARVARRSLFAAQTIAAGSVVTRDMVSMKRPGTGISPVLLKKIVGHRTLVDVTEGQMLELGMFD
jgi:N-acetylneuraminate synthase/N,N'-diacetyllegionaminate synthase